MTDILCTKCGKNEFDEWYAKDKGQKFPFKSCPSCRQKNKEKYQEIGKEDAMGSDVRFIEALERIAVAVEQIADKEIPIGEPTKADFTKKYSGLKDEEDLKDYEDLKNSEGDKVPF